MGAGQKREALSEGGGSCPLAGHGQRSGCPRRARDSRAPINRRALHSGSLSGVGVTEVAGHVARGRRIGVSSVTRPSRPRRAARTTGIGAVEQVIVRRAVTARSDSNAAGSRQLRGRGSGHRRAGGGRCRTVRGRLGAKGSSVRIPPSRPTRSLPTLDQNTRSAGLLLLWVRFGELGAARSWGSDGDRGARSTAVVIRPPAVPLPAPWRRRDYVWPRCSTRWPHARPASPSCSSCIRRGPRFHRTRGPSSSPAPASSLDVPVYVGTFLFEDGRRPASRSS